MYDQGIAYLSVFLPFIAVVCMLMFVVLFSMAWKHEKRARAERRRLGISEFEHYYGKHAFDPTWHKPDFADDKKSRERR